MFPLVRAALTSLVLLAVAFGSPASHAAAPEGTDDQAAASGRMFVEGTQTYGEVLDRRTLTSGQIDSAVIYPVRRQRDAASGQPAVAVISGVRVDCGAERIRYLYHEGYGADGLRLYRADVPQDIAWNSGSRVSGVISALCSDPESGAATRFDGVVDFIQKAGAAPTGAPAVVTPG